MNKIKLLCVACVFSHATMTLTAEAAPIVFTGVYSTGTDGSSLKLSFTLDDLNLGPVFYYGPIGSFAGLLDFSMETADTFGNIRSVDFSTAKLFGADLVFTTTGTLTTDGSENIGNVNDINVFNFTNGTDFTLHGFDTNYVNDVDTGENYFLQSLTVSTVPIPATAWLFGSGLIGLISVARRKA